MTNLVTGGKSIVSRCISLDAVLDVESIRRNTGAANIMVTSYEELVPGYEFPPARYELSASLISEYVKAVDNPNELKIFDEFVPPLAMAAHAMAGMSGSLSLPPGSIHASQEFEFFKLVPVGATIHCQARVARKLSRGKMRMLVLEIDVFDQSKEKVQSGKATIMLPA